MYVLARMWLLCIQQMELYIIVLCLLYVHVSIMLYIVTLIYDRHKFKQFHAQDRAYREKLEIETKVLKVLKASRNHHAMRSRASLVISFHCNRACLCSGFQA